MSKTIDELMKDFENKMGLTKHPFKKGNYLINDNYQSSPVTVRLKVVAADKYSVLVKDLDSKGIPFTLPHKSIHKHRIMSSDEIKEVKKDMFMKKFFLTPCDIMVSLGRSTAKVLGLQHTRNPNNLKDYVANWVAYEVTFFARLGANYWDKKINNPNMRPTSLWKIIRNSAAHGPLWKGHDYQEK